MCGGNQQDFDGALPLLQQLGKTIVLHGGAGSGQHAKIVNQILIAGCMLGIAEGLSFARKSGLDPDRVLESVSTGAAGSWALANLAPRALKGDFAPGFFIQHFVKDLGIALAEARRLNLDLPMTQLAEMTYSRLVSLGHAHAGTQAIVHAYA
jgi:3-hydroxyisobutyrate dehydrogenase